MSKKKILIFTGAGVSASTGMEKVKQDLYKIFN